MRVLIVSDTHGRDDTFYDIIADYGPFDRVIHCGDVEGQEDVLRAEADCPMDIVAGNNDYFSMLPRELEFMLGKYRVWLTHGHNYLVYMGNETIIREASGRDVDIVMYGHTHKPSITKADGVIALNPGSLTFPRQTGHNPSFIIMTIDDDGEAEFEIEYV